MYIQQCSALTTVKVSLCHLVLYSISFLHIPDIPFKMFASAPDNLSPPASLPASVESVDAGVLELGIMSAWTHNDTFVTSVEQSESVRAEPPSSGPTDESGSDRSCGCWPCWGGIECPLSF